jgi:FlaA1/EpsC-like NDP-sugar epimerase
MERLSSATGRPSQVLLYGAGRHTSRLLAEKQCWEKAGHRVIGLLDDHPRFEDEAQHLGLPVQARTKLLRAVQNGLAAPSIVLSTDTFEDQFWEQTAELRLLGCAVYRLYGNAA